MLFGMLALVALVAASSFGISGQAETREEKFRGALLAQTEVNAAKAPMTLEAIDRELVKVAAARPGYALPVIAICFGAPLALIGLPLAFVGLLGGSMVLLVAGLIAIPVGLAMLIGGIAGAVTVGHDRRVLDARARELEAMKNRASEPQPTQPPSVDSVMRPAGGLTLALF